ncbi:MAG: T9SS type A sorting domain-containing protein [Ignavibacteria bacterium]|nr:T9SS type A sorting domain-containing protein [Ignavibacteria bacterium]
MKVSKFLLLILSSLLITSLSYSQYVSEGMTPRVLENSGQTIKIEFTFNGYNQSEVKINGESYIALTTPGFASTMVAGEPEIPIFRKSVVIPDLSAMSYRILSEETEVISIGKIMPSKGHFTRDIDPNSIPYTFGSVYSTDEFYPGDIVKLDEPYIVRDLRGMTVQINPLQYNPVKGQLKIYKKLTIEIYVDAGKTAVNPFYRLRALNKVSGEYAPFYREMFMNYGMGVTRFDSIPEPGKMLVVCPTAYMTTIQPFISWKQARGMDVTVAEYPTITGSGAAAIKTYIQNMYNSTGSVTYIILVGDYADMPTLSGVYEAAASDPCYVKLAGTDAYPDAFISRISCQNAASINYVITKFIKFERDIVFGAPWYNKGTGVAGPDNGGTPSYTDSIRMNWVRDTLLLGGFTHVDKINHPAQNAQSLITVLNDGRYILNYIGHGSGTSWSNTGFNVTNAYQLANGWMNPYLVDVACLNGKFTLNECLAEALLRAGDTASPRGVIGAYASSTNASWVPPCDMQLFANHMLSRQKRKTAGAMSFFGVMYAMDKWGGSSGEGLKLMEQYNILGDCSVLLTRGVPLGPSISHTPLPNTENVTGPYPVNCVVNTANAPLVPNSTKLFWSRNSTTVYDSVLMTNTSGNNWSANIPGNGIAATYRYYIMTIDTMGRIGKLPGNCPAEVFSFIASPDNVNPVITHTVIGETPKLQWPPTVTASATDNIGIDSVWVRWYKNSTSNGINHFKLLFQSGSNYSAAFNSPQSYVEPGDSIFYRIFAMDNSSAHNTDSTQLYSFKIINQATINIGTGTTSTGWPFYTFYMDSRTDMLYLGSEINVPSGGYIQKIGFNVISAASQTMNGFMVKMQNTTATSITGFTSTGWTTAYSGTYTVTGTGWQYIQLQTPFHYEGDKNLLIEICFNNSSYTSNTTVNGSAATNRNKHQHSDLSSGDGCVQLTSPSTSYTTLPNISLILNPGTTGLSQIGNELPTKYDLAQNYPNPFNPTTKINFAIPKQGLVTLKVYDVLGREVANLVNDVKAAGNYTIDFDASYLASGVYFYRLDVNGFTDVKRMMLIK